MKYPILVLGGFLSWWPFMAVHEIGHILSGLANGGSIESVSIPLLGFSETVIYGSANMALDTWAGPVLGSMFPLLLLIPHYRNKYFQYACSIFAGFCLIGNGVYIGIGWSLNAGDAGLLQRLGHSVILMSAFGIISCAFGLFIWHRGIQRFEK